MLWHTPYALPNTCYAPVIISVRPKEFESHEGGVTRQKQPDSGEAADVGEREPLQRSCPAKLSMILAIELLGRVCGSFSFSAKSKASNKERFQFRLQWNSAPG
jgi:hypothetical protein